MKKQIGYSDLSDYLKFLVISGSIFISAFILAVIFTLMQYILFSL